MTYKTYIMGCKMVGDSRGDIVSIMYLLLKTSGVKH